MDLTAPWFASRVELLRFTTRHDREVLIVQGLMSLGPKMVSRGLSREIGFRGKLHHPIRLVAVLGALRYMSTRRSVLVEYAHAVVRASQMHGT